MVTSIQRPTVNLAGLRTRWSKQPARLRTLTWDQLKELGGTKKIQVINDFRRHGIMLEVRLLADKLTARLTPEQQAEVRAEGLRVAVPNAQSWLAPDPGDEYDDEVLTLTGDWQRVSALVGFWLRDQSFRNPLLGAAFTDERYVKRVNPDGGVEWKLDLVRTPRVALLDFRAPGDTGADVPVTAAGLVLPGFRGATGQRPPAGEPLTWDDDTPGGDEPDLYTIPDPELEAEREAAALAALEPTDAELHAHIRRRRGGG